MASKSCRIGSSTSCQKRFAPPTKWRWCSNAIVLGDYAPTGARGGVRRELGLSDDDRLVGVIGRISIEKGCLEMVDAFAAVAGKHPGIHLAFIGEGPLAATVAERARASGLEARVRFLGHQTRIQPFYEAIDLLVSPSRTEGISNVILEALASGCPVVATPVGRRTSGRRHEPVSWYPLSSRRRWRMQ